MTRSTEFHQRYFLPILALVAVAFGAVGYQTVSSLRRLVEGELERNVVAAVEDLARRSTVDLLLRDQAALGEQLKLSLVTNTDLTGGGFRDGAGLPMAASGAQVLADQQSSPVATLGVVRRAGWLVATAPVVDGTGAMVGNAWLAASTERVRGEVWASAQRLLLAIAAGLASIAGLAWTLLGRLRGFAETLERRVEERTKELALARDRALESNRLKSEFLATMSHEIRTPMNGVLGMASLLRESDLTARQARFVEAIQTSGDSLMTIINDILDFSKIEAGKLRIEMAEFDLRATVESIISLHRPAADTKGLTLQLHHPASRTVGLVGDAARIRQVITNLVGNAIKFTNQGRVDVQVEERVTGGAVAIEVRIMDTGIGIPPEATGRIFEKFIQADASTTRRYGGTGLGLAIAAQLVELMGGTIGVESTPGVGSTFWFRLQLPANPPR